MQHDSLERATIKSKRLHAVVLPALGGKIASLRWLPRNVELLQIPLAPYAQRTADMSFDEGDASGFDECLPSISECDVPTPHGSVHVPDHGDFWRLPWTFRRQDSSIWMEATGVSLPLRFERVLRLADSTGLSKVAKHSDPEALSIEYLVQNNGASPTQYIWSAHPLFTVDPGDRILLPESVTQVRVEGSARQRLGEPGGIIAWPRTKSRTGEDVDLSIAGKIEDEIGDKLYAIAPPEGWAAIERLGRGVRIEVRFDPTQVPYLGLWLCFGGWPEGKEVRQQCVAVEPCMAPVDSLAAAVEGRWAKRLGPGEMHRWRMQILVSNIGLINT